MSSIRVIDDRGRIRTINRPYTNEERARMSVNYKSPIGTSNTAAQERPGKRKILLDQGDLGPNSGYGHYTGPHFRRQNRYHDPVDTWDGNTLRVARVPQTLKNLIGVLGNLQNHIQETMHDIQGMMHFLFKCNVSIRLWARPRRTRSGAHWIVRPHQIDSFSLHLDSMDGKYLSPEQPTIQEGRKERLRELYFRYLTELLNLPRELTCEYNQYNPDDIRGNISINSNTFAFEPPSNDGERAQIGELLLSILRFGCSTLTPLRMFEYEDGEADSFLAAELQVTLHLSSEYLMFRAEKDAKEVFLSRRYEDSVLYQPDSDFVREVAARYHIDSHS